MTRWKYAVMTAAMMLAAPAQAQDNIVDIGDVRTVAGLMMQAGYKAEIKKSKSGENYISSGANGNDFSIIFYGCKKDTACGSLELTSWYKKAPYFSTALTNEWNAQKRFMKIAIDGDGDLTYYVFVSAIGGTTFKNFADYISWFSDMDGELAKFLDEKKKAFEAAAAMPPAK